MRAMNRPPPSHASHKAAAPPTRVQWLTIDADQAGQRVDNFLMARLKGVPKSRIYNILRKGEVRVNKGRVKPDYRLVAGDQVRVPPVRVSERPAPDKPSDQLVKTLARAILFESDGLLVINKPPGLAVHGGSGISLGLIEVLRQMRPEARFLELVHRLDRDTSGCLMVAKKRSMLRHLQSALRDKGKGGVTKIYHSLVGGRWPAGLDKVDVPLMRFEVNGERIVKVHPEGKPSLTLFRVLERYDGATLMEANLITGRTHQIRVHAQSTGHSLLGDEKYGNDAANRQWRERGVRRLFLHAAELRFYLPDANEPTCVKAPLPDDLSSVLDALKC